MSFFAHLTSSLTEAPLSSPFYRWGNWDTCFVYFLTTGITVTQLVNVEVDIWAQAVWHHERRELKSLEERHSYVAQPSSLWGSGPLREFTAESCARSKYILFHTLFLVVFFFLCFLFKISMSGCLWLNSFKLNVHMMSFTEPPKWGFCF